MQEPSATPQGTLDRATERVTQAVLAVRGPQVAHVAMDLPDLGLSRVSVAVADGHATVELGFTSADAARRAEDLGEGLRERLAAHGLDLQDFSVREDTQGSGSAAGLTRSSPETGPLSSAFGESLRDRLPGQRGQAGDLAARADGGADRGFGSGDTPHQGEGRAHPPVPYPSGTGSVAPRAGATSPTGTRSGHSLDMLM